uniref:Uncharacterized protein n=1 Tax=Setaria digitata TaxID=48799 RepID=A0A915PBB5_9BILA
MRKVEKGQRVVSSCPSASHLDDSATVCNVRGDGENIYRKSKHRFLKEEMEMKLGNLAGSLDAADMEAMAVIVTDDDIERVSVIMSDSGSESKMYSSHKPRFIN